MPAILGAKRTAAHVEARAVFKTCASFFSDGGRFPEPMQQVPAMVGFHRAGTHVEVDTEQVSMLESKHSVAVGVCNKHIHILVGTYSCSPTFVNVLSQDIRIVVICPNIKQLNMCSTCQQSLGQQGQLPMLKLELSSKHEQVFFWWWSFSRTRATSSNNYWVPQSRYPCWSRYIVQ